jgi:hypothetical protein
VPEVARYIERKIRLDNKKPGIPGDGVETSRAVKKAKKSPKKAANTVGSSTGGAVTAADRVVGTVAAAAGAGTVAAATGACTITAATGAGTSATTGAFTGLPGLPMKSFTALPPLRAVTDCAVDDYGDTAACDDDYASKPGSELRVKGQAEQLRRKEMLERRLDSSLLNNRAFGSQLSQKTSNDEAVRLLGLLRQSRLYCEQGLPPYTTDNSGRVTKNQVFVNIYRDCTDFILKYIGDEKDEERLCSDDYEPSV